MIKMIKPFSAEHLSKMKKRKNKVIKETAQDGNILNIAKNNLSRLSSWPCDRKFCVNNRFEEHQTKICWK